jgi:hypothetical protein
MEARKEEKEEGAKLCWEVTGVMGDGADQH